MNNAIRYNNAIKIAMGDYELEEIIEAEFSRVKLDRVESNKVPQISFILFNDFSYLINVDKVETLIDDDPREIGIFLDKISNKYPEQVIEFLEILSSVAKKNIASYTFNQ